MNEFYFRFRRIQAILMVATILTIVFIATFAATLGESQSTKIAVSPDIVDLALAETVTMTIRVEGVENLYGLELNIRYDPTIVRVDSIRPGTFLNADFVVEQKINNDTGRSSLAYTQIGHPARSGSGDIAELVLRKTDCLGQSPLQLANVILSDENGNAIPHTLSSGQTQSGSPAAIRRLTGTIFYDSDDDGKKGSGEENLPLWPIYTQRFGVDLTGLQHMALSDQNGAFQFADLACGRYQVWSRNSLSSVLTRTVDLPVSVDLQIPALPLTGTLDYPLDLLFLPALYSP